MFVEEKGGTGAAIIKTKRGWSFVIKWRLVERYLSSDILTNLIRSYDEGLWVPRLRSRKELSKIELYRLALINKLPPIGIPVYEDGIRSYEDFINGN